MTPEAGADLVIFIVGAGPEGLVFDGTNIWVTSIDPQSDTLPGSPGYGWVGPIYNLRCLECGTILASPVLFTPLPSRFLRTSAGDFGRYAILD